LGGHRVSLLGNWGSGGIAKLLLRRRVSSSWRLWLLHWRVVRSWWLRLSILLRLLHSTEGINLLNWLSVNWGWLWLSVDWGWLWLNVDWSLLSLHWSHNLLSVSLLRDRSILDGSVSGSWVVEWLLLGKLSGQLLLGELAWTLGRIFSIKFSRLDEALSFLNE